MSLGKNIRMRRIAYGYTVEELASRIGVSRQTVFRYENGQIATIPHEKLEALSEALGTTPVALMAGDPPPSFAARPLPAVRKIPLVLEVRSGDPFLDYKNAIPLYGEESDAAPDMCFSVKDQAMSGARITEGDSVFIRETETVENGAIALVSVSGELMLRRVYDRKEEGKLILTAENPAVPPLVFLGLERSEVKIVGRAVLFQSHVR